MQCQGTFVCSSERLEWTVEHLLFPEKWGKSIVPCSRLRTRSDNWAGWIDLRVETQFMVIASFSSTRHSGVVRRQSANSQTHQPRHGDLLYTFRLGLSKCKFPRLPCNKLVSKHVPPPSAPARPLALILVDKVEKSRARKSGPRKNPQRC